MVETPYRKIVVVAAAETIDLIVMPTCGRTGLTDFVRGSVAERVPSYAELNHGTAADAALTREEHG